MASLHLPWTPPRAKPHPCAASQGLQTLGAQHQPPGAYAKAQEIESILGHITKSANMRKGCKLHGFRVTELARGQMAEQHYTMVTFATQIQCNMARLNLPSWLHLLGLSDMHHAPLHGKDPAKAPRAAQTLQILCCSLLEPCSI